jgi:predicted Zn-ribbon and HTH transcriptional regulator
MVDIIGNTAGKIWNVLSQQESPINMTELSGITKIKSQVVYQALGWLAREGKLEYHKKGAKICVKLVPAECSA